jgi:hypothetical protein
VWLTGGHTPPRKESTFLLTYRVLWIHKRGAERLNTSSHEVARGVLDRGPSRWSLVEVLAKKGLYMYRHLGYREFGKEEPRVFDPRTRELRVVKGDCAKASCGRVRVKLAPSACSHRWGF